MDTYDKLWLKRVRGRCIRQGSCLVWAGAVDSWGYGAVWYRGRTVGVHRRIWLLVRGPIPDGLEIDHTCEVEICCRPSHMELVTTQENNKRRGLRNKKT